MQPDQTQRPLTATEKIALAQTAYRQYQALCFWYARPDLAIGWDDLEWVAAGLRRHGDREAFRLAAQLCR